MTSYSQLHKMSHLEQAAMQGEALTLYLFFEIFETIMFVCSCDTLILGVHATHFYILYFPHLHQYVVLRFDFYNNFDHEHYN